MNYLICRRILFAVVLSLSLSVPGLFADVAAADVQAQSAAKDAKDSKEKSSKEKASDAKAEKKPTGVHHLTLRGLYTELPYTSFNPLAMITGGNAKQKSYYRLANYVDELAERDDLQYIVFDLSKPYALEPSACRDLCLRIAKLREQGKKTIAYVEFLATPALCLAGACDEIYMSKDGLVDIPSASMEQVFYKDLFDFAGIRVSHVRAGDFKGAVEPYTRSSMSPHLREHYLGLLSSQNEATVERIGKSLKLSPASVRELQKQRLMLPKEAKKRGLVDRLTEPAKMREAVATRIGGELVWSQPKPPKPKPIGLADILAALMQGETDKKVKQPSIVVYHLSGTIVDGNKARGGQVVSGPTVAAIDELRNNDQVKGVVVRINSPGGGAGASEAIRVALAKLVAAKPTVFSMGNVAASGGYLVACADAPIYADVDTITGSIGVFGMQMSYDPLKRRFGVLTETVALDAAAAQFRPGQPWSEEETEKLQAFVDTSYDQFLARVSKARSMNVDELKKLAGGRVWTGAQAKELGLVDKIGGLQACIAYVRGEIGKEVPHVKHLPEVTEGFDLAELLGSDEEEIFHGELAKRLAGLSAMGFETQSLEFLLRNTTSTKMRPQQPQLWMLQPMNFHIR